MTDVPETHTQSGPADDHHPARSGHDQHAGHGGHDKQRRPRSGDVARVFDTAPDPPSGDCEPAEVVPVAPSGNVDAPETESPHVFGAEHQKSADAVAPTRPGQRRGSRTSEMLVVVAVVLIMVAVAVFVIEIATH